jgi:serine/threonine-protein kinase RsbW
MEQFFSFMKDGFVIIKEVSIASSYDELNKVESLITESCGDLGVNEDAYGNVLIAVTEAVNNAIEHGNKRLRGLSVSVMVGDNNDEFCYAIKDQGSGFDYNDLPDPTAPENMLKENGRGVFLMRSLADEVVFSHGGSQVYIYFKK